MSFERKDYNCRLVQIVFAGAGSGQILGTSSNRKTIVFLGGQTAYRFAPSAAPVAAADGQSVNVGASPTIFEYPNFGESLNQPWFVGVAAAGTVNVLEVIGN